MNSFSAFLAVAIHLGTFGFIFFSLFYNGPGETLAYTLVAYVCLMVVNSMRMMFGSANALVTYDTWQDD